MVRARGHVGATPQSQRVTRPIRVTAKHDASSAHLHSAHTSHTPALLGGTASLGDEGKKQKQKGTEGAARFVQKRN